MIGVIYWSGTGNTEQMAQAVAEGIKAAGQEVEVKIISLNKDEKKLGLALTELMEAKETAEDAE